MSPATGSGRDSDARTCRDGTLLVLATGRIMADLLARRDRPGEMLTIRPSDRATTHARHEHKYAKRRAEDRHGFHFRTGPGRLSGAVAHTLDEPEAEIELRADQEGRPPVVDEARRSLLRVLRSERKVRESPPGTQT